MPPTPLCPSASTCSPSSPGPALSNDGNTLLGEIYGQHHRWLTGWLTKMLGCPHHAADLSQDTFVRVITHTDIRTVSEHRPWLATIAKRLLIDKTRRLKLEKAYLQALSQAPQVTEAPSAEQLLVAVQTLGLINQALNKLADKPQRAFVLRHVKGQTQAAIAQQLGVSVTMVRNYLVQGLVACHDAIEADQP